MRRAAARLLGVLLLCALPAASAPGQASGGGRLPVRVAGGRLVLRCDVSAGHARIPVHLLVEIDNPARLLLHPDLARDLGLEEGDAVTLNIPGCELDAFVPGEGPAKVYDELTRRYALELEEIACAGTLGLGALALHHVVLDLSAGEILLEPRRDALAEPPLDRQGRQAPLEESAGLLWFPVELCETRAWMALATSTFDTLVDAAECARQGRPAGDLAPFRASQLDLAPFVALRPARLAARRAGGVGQTGLNLLLCLRVEIDLVNHLVAFAPVSSPDYPEEDFACFQALAEGTPEALERYLEGHPAARLSEEAADILLAARLEAGAEGEKALLRALDWVHRTRPADLKTSAALSLVELFVQQGRASAAIHAGELGISTARDDRDPLAAHRIHSAIGRLHLDQGNLKEAHRHLLSAAFGLKHDGAVRVDLCRLYEAQGKPQRAFSQFVLGLTYPETAAQALSGMKRTQGALADARGLSTEAIAELLEGRVPAFRTADRYQPAEEGDEEEEETADGAPRDTVRRTALIELFTCAHADACYAAELGLEGLLDYFPREHLAALAYHLPLPQPDPLMNPLSLRAAERFFVQSAPTAVIDGSEEIDAGGGESEVEEVYRRYRAAVTAVLETSAQHRLQAKARLEDDVLRGSVEVAGPADPALQLEIVLAEKTVLFPGKNKIVLPCMVARAALTPGAEGVRFAPEGGRQVVEFSRSLSAVGDELAAHLEEYEAGHRADFTLRPTRIDPEQVTVVAILRNRFTQEVRQTVQIEPEVPGAERE
ncbi:MAG: hypothetical protein HY812_08595 [Planctomycetes bacterium]|nr:hypothetical protein [Planctomycetota bacterium]